MPSNGNFTELADSLSAAVMRQDIPNALLLLESGANPNGRPKQHMLPLHCAVEQQNADLVRILCSRGADVDYPTEEGFTPLHLAVDVEADTAW